MLRLTSSQIDRAKSLVSDIFICAGIVPNTRDDGYTHENWSITNPDAGYISKYKPATETIVKFMTRRTFNFGDIETALYTLKNYRAEFGETPTSTSVSWNISKPVTAAKYIAYICQLNHIYWDDTSYTPDERKELVSSSYVAQCLFEAECFATQPTTKPRVRKTTTVDDTTGATTTTTTTAKSSYKSAGPQSANVAGLVSKPGEKETVSSSTIYCIMGDKAGTIIPNAFIHPVNNTAAGEKAKVNAAGLPVVKFGAGNGYTDLTIYSTDSDLMEKIMKELDGRGLFSKYSGVHVATVKTNASGYYRVNSEFGEVLVKPTKLNEKLFAEAFEAMTAKEDEDLIEDFPTAGRIENIGQFVRDSKMYD